MGHECTIRTFKGNSCIHLALLNGHEQTTHLLLQYFPQFINDKGERGKSPLHIACMFDYDRCLNLLIGLGADINVIDDNGDGVMHLCLQYSSLKCMHVLIKEGKLINDDQERDKDNWRPSDVISTFEMGIIYKKALTKRKLQVKSKTNGPFSTPVESVVDKFQGLKLNITTPLTINQYQEGSPAPAGVKSPKIDIPVFTPTQRNFPDRDRDCLLYTSRCV